MAKVLSFYLLFQTDISLTQTKDIFYSSESYGLAVEHSAHDRKVVGSIPMLDGNGFKAMPGLIPAPNILVHTIIENTGSQMGQTKKKKKKIVNIKI